MWHQPEAASCHHHWWLREITLWLPLSNILLLFLHGFKKLVHLICSQCHSVTQFMETLLTCCFILFAQTSTKRRKWPEHSALISQIYLAYFHKLTLVFLFSLFVFLDQQYFHPAWVHKYKQVSCVPIMFLSVVQIPLGDISMMSCLFLNNMTFSCNSSILLLNVNNSVKASS